MFSFEQENGILAVTTSTRGIPSGVPYKKVTGFPEDNLFRDSWENLKEEVTENLDKAKEICHTYRRTSRTIEFRPYDEIIALRIPETVQGEAETTREEIREKYAVIQEEIDNATSTAALRTIVAKLYKD